MFVYRFRDEKGVSLIAVMWIITILTVLASEFMYSMQLEIRIARNWSDQVRAYYAAKAGLETAVAMLRDDETGHDSLDEEWTEELSDQLNNSVYTTTVTDESARINLNTVNQEILTNAILYCMGTTTDDILSEEQSSSEAQTLANAVIEKRPFNTVAEAAKAAGMTPEILYGRSAEEELLISTDPTAVLSENEENEEETEASALVDIATVYSVDKNTTSDGNERVNLNTADANQIREGVNGEGDEIITEQEAQSIVDYRNEESEGQQGGQQGEQQPTDPDNPDGQQQQVFNSITQLLDVPAISQSTLDIILERITTDDQEGEEGDRININTADVNQLQELEGIDSGIAESIVNHRQQNQFENVEQLRDVKLINMDEFVGIVDRITVTDESVLQGKININTAPLEILRMLPGMDDNKAQAIVDYRTVESGSAFITSDPESNEPGPFTDLGRLLNVEGFDEQTFREIIDHITYRSHAYRIESEGKSLDGKIIESCNAVIDRSGNRIIIKYWKQG
ncbi:hypothetical protein GF312_01725 [Candidatus Poribacteria bacterium]|nr:hypothetical protein [Candidatus Poribacteria bacterium]